MITYSLVDTTAVLAGARNMWMELLNYNEESRLASFSDLFSMWLSEVV